MVEVDLDVVVEMVVVVGDLVAVVVEMEVMVVSDALTLFAVVVGVVVAGVVVVNVENVLFCDSVSSVAS